jgi:isocitrate dehydrogenase
MAKKTPITVAHGDGIGPEIMDATLKIIEAGGAQLDIETIEIGEKVYEAGIKNGIRPEAWESLKRTKVFLKAPITTPQGGGFKSLNVTVRKTLGMYANVRPCVSYAPFIDTKHPDMNLVIVRENEEDLYAGIEYQLSPNVVECIKLISLPGSERICRYAFEYAVVNNRKKVTCFTKDNIMKLSDGLFHKTFDRVAEEFPKIENEHWIVDIGSAKMADTPEVFDVIVLPNLYGDILSDVAAQIAGSVGLAGSANIGDYCSMFEAIHGSAPRRAGQNMANPSGLLHGAIMMLVHIGQADAASKVHNAWLKTIEDGVHTYDIFDEKVSKEKVGTKEFADAVVARLGQEPTTLKPVHYVATGEAKPVELKFKPDVKERKLVGVDIFVYDPDRDTDKLAEKVQAACSDKFKLHLISSRGTKVWPEGQPETYRADQSTCRFFANGAISNADVVGLLNALSNADIEFLKTEQLYEYDGEPVFLKAQGE